MNADTPDTHDDHRNGVVVIVKRKSDNAILVADALYGNRLGMLPGGGIYADETPRTAMARELREETGIILPETALCHWGTFSQKTRGNRPDGPLLDGLLLAFEVTVDLQRCPAYLNDEAANQRFENPVDIFRAGEAAYGTTALRLIGRYLTRRLDTGETEGRMRDRVPVLISLPSGDERFEF
jgi:8-oxo-dGTP pyrophosphatase MutT (NUDIX family)